jgi:hypothetical protein
MSYIGWCIGQRGGREGEGVYVNISFFSPKVFFKIGSGVKIILVVALVVAFNSSIQHLFNTYRVRT